MTATIDRFMPVSDVREHFAIDVRAPADLAFDTAGDFDFSSIPLVRGIFWMRGKVMGSSGPPVASTGIFALTASLGWGTLSHIEGREHVAGAVTQPWLADVKFRAVEADRFAAFTEPGFVKIVWTIEAEPLDAARCRLRTETRALATDDASRRKFLAYWRWARFGILPIRWLALPAIKRRAEHAFRTRHAGP
jgi:hypothetical protein